MGAGVLLIASVGGTAGPPLPFFDSDDEIASPATALFRLLIVVVTASASKVSELYITR